MAWAEEWLNEAAKVDRDKLLYPLERDVQLAARGVAGEPILEFSTKAGYVLASKAVNQWCVEVT